MNPFQYFCNYFYVVVLVILPNYLFNCPSLLQMFSVFQDLLKGNTTTVSVSPFLRPICKFTDRSRAKHRGNLGEIGTPTEDKLLAKEYQTEFIRVCSYLFLLSIGPNGNQVFFWTTILCIYIFDRACFLVVFRVHPIRFRFQALCKRDSNGRNGDF